MNPMFEIAAPVVVAGDSSQPTSAHAHAHAEAPLPFSASSSLTSSFSQKPEMGFGLPLEFSTHEYLDLSPAGFQEAPTTPEEILQEDSRSLSPPSSRPSHTAAGRPKAHIIIQNPGQTAAVPVKVFPNDTAYEKYIRRRANNNLAANKCRQKKKEQEMTNLQRADLLERENATLKVELQKLQAEVSSLKGIIHNYLNKERGGGDAF